MNRSFHRLSFVLALLAGAAAHASGSYDGAAGTPGSLAVAKDDTAFVAWAAGFTDLVRGPAQINDLSKGYVSFGSGEQTLGVPGNDVYDVVSLGDGGRITLTFAAPIADGPGWDFAVFENNFGDAFLELAFVEVSSNGTDFFRFDAFSETPGATQIGGFGSVNPTHLRNLAGKYRFGFGTPFDLAELAGRSPLLDVTAITPVRIIDAVGTINPLYASTDSLGRVVNEPWPTPFATGGFDLDAVGVRHVADGGAYATWWRAQFTAAERADSSVAGDDADPDGDGRVNLLEYALGSSARDATDGRANEPAPAIEAGHLSLSYIRPEGRGDVAVKAEWSADLVSWYSDSGYVSVPSVEPVVGGMRVTFTSLVDPAAHPRQFLRLVVTRL